VSSIIRVIGFFPSSIPPLYPRQHSHLLPSIQCFCDAKTTVSFVSTYDSFFVTMFAYKGRLWVLQSPTAVLLREAEAPFLKPFATFSPLFGNACSCRIPHCAVETYWRTRNTAYLDSSKPFSLPKVGSMPFPFSVSSQSLVEFFPLWGFYQKSEPPLSPCVLSRDWGRPLSRQTLFFDSLPISVTKI